MEGNVLLVELLKKRGIILESLEEARLKEAEAREVLEQFQKEVAHLEQRLENIKTDFWNNVRKELGE